MKGELRFEDQISAPANIFHNNKPKLTTSRTAKKVLQNNNKNNCTILRYKRAHAHMYCHDYTTDKQKQKLITNALVLNYFMYQL